MSGTDSTRRAAADRNVARIVREFDYSRETIFRMFTDPKKAYKWFGSPEGAITVQFELDARPGGAVKIYDRGTEGPVHKTVGTVTEVVEPSRFAFRSVTTLADGETPFEALQTVTLDEVSPKKTRMTVVVKVLSVGSFPGGIESLVAGFEGGWGESLNKLERELG